MDGRSGAAGSGIRALRRLTAPVESTKSDTLAPTRVTVAPARAGPARVILASDSASVSWATEAALGADVDGALLRALGEMGDGRSSDAMGAGGGERTSAIASLAAAGDWGALLSLLSDDSSGRGRPRRGVNDRVGSEARSALHYAAAAARVDVVLALLGAGADARALGAPPARRSPLHAAADAPLEPEGGRGRDQCDACLASIVSALVGAGADVHAAEGDYGSTALHLSAARGRTSVCEALIAAGASTLAVDRLGDTPGDVAADAGHDGLAPILAPKV
jgi:hypothetical protein